MPRRRRDLLEVENLGPIRNISLELGDLTLLVGAHCTGKSIALQLLKLAHDGPSIAHTARANGLVWSTTPDFLDAYLGSGLGTTWRKGSALRWRGKAVPLPPRSISTPHEPRVLYVPAQRSITIADGWPRPFTAYRNAPYVVRELGLDLQGELLRSRGGQLFPSPSRLDAGLRRAIDQAVFHKGTLALRQESVQNEMKLVHGKAELSYMVWSTGQREFVPLLLALYRLLPASAKTKHRNIDWVILEEPEMGLHPEAIVATAALVLDLLHRGYRVVISTHHPLMAKSVLTKDCRVYDLVHTDEGVVSKDIDLVGPFLPDGGPHPPEPSSFIGNGDHSQGRSGSSAT